MNDDEQEIDRELLARLRRAASISAPAARHEEIRARVLEVYDTASQELTWKLHTRILIHKGVRIMTHPYSRMAITAAAVLTVAIWWAVPRRSVALADFLAPIVNAKTAQFKCTVESDVPNGDATAVGYFLAPARIRQEFTKPQQMTSIADFERGRMLSLMPDQKQAMIFELKGKLSEDKIRQSNFFGNLRATLESYRQGDQKVRLEELGEKELDGRRVFGFRIVSTGQVQTLWGDVATGQPVRVESTYLGPPKSEVVMSDFEFDKPLAESLFSIEPPADYKSFTVPIDTTPPSEEDLITSLRKVTDALDGEFPAALDTPGIARAFVKLFKGQEDSEAMMTEGVTIGRGLQFAMLLPVDADAHYAGKGVKRDGPRAPIFWYRQSETKQLRVIYNDLTVQDADAAPEVSDAIRMVDQMTPAPAEGR